MESKCRFGSRDVSQSPNRISPSPPSPVLLLRIPFPYYYLHDGTLIEHYWVEEETLLPPSSQHENGVLCVDPILTGGLSSDDTKRIAARTFYGRRTRRRRRSPVVRILIGSNVCGITRLPLLLACLDCRLLRLKSTPSIHPHCVTEWKSTAITATKSFEGAPRVLSGDGGWKC